VITNIDISAGGVRLNTDFRLGSTQLLKIMIPSKRQRRRDIAALPSTLCRISHCLIAGTILSNSMPQSVDDLIERFCGSILSKFLYFVAC
jgi:hypothetical protein